MWNFRSEAGFSLLELMTAFVVVAILTIVGLPSYKEYVNQAKVAEAIVHINAIVTAEKTYFSENSSFYTVNIGSASGRVPISKSQVSTGGAVIGNPIPVGAWTSFFYMASAGKTDTAGTVQTGTGLLGSWPWAPAPNLEGGSSFCGNLIMSSNFVVPQGKSKFDWVWIQGFADFQDQVTGSNRESCTVAVTVLSHQNDAFSLLPIIIFKESSPTSMSGPDSTSGETSSSSSSSSSTTSSSSSSSSTTDSSSSSSSSSDSSSTTDSSSSDSRDATSGDTELDPSTSSGDTRDATSEDTRDATSGEETSGDTR